MSEGKPQWITHLKTHFNSTVQAVLQIFNSLLSPPGISQQNLLYIFICGGKKINKRNVFPPSPQPAGMQPNHFNYIPNGCNLHIATSQCCVSETSTAGLTFWANEIFLISRKRPNQKERGAVQLRKQPKLCYSLIWIRKIVSDEITSTQIIHSDRHEDRSSAWEPEVR